MRVYLPAKSNKCLDKVQKVSARIWMMNHYATKMLVNEGGRHYWFAKHLKKQGYEPIIFSCNVKHGGKESAVYFESDKRWTQHESSDDIPFVVIRSSRYTGNGLSRIKNMLIFARNLVKTGQEYAKKYGRPDVILASSVHPLTVFAGQKLARKFKVPCICEVRDLWPESIFAYYPKKKNGPLAKLLYAGEKYMYKRADAIVMTWEGGAQYIKDKGWERAIPEEKIWHIPNGVDLDEFESNRINHVYYDEDLADETVFNAVYTGAIRAVNEIDTLVQAARILQGEGEPQKIRILIWGAGDQVEQLKGVIEGEGLECIRYKGVVDKRYIPSLLSQADCCVLHNRSTILDQLGQSQNKFFEYLAAAKPVLVTYTVGYSVCERFGCGVELPHQDGISIAEALKSLASGGEATLRRMGEKAKEAAAEYDFARLTEKLVTVIDMLLDEDKKGSGGFHGKY